MMNTNKILAREVIDMNSLSIRPNALHVVSLTRGDLGTHQAEYGIVSMCSPATSISA